jgi:hypothetical protein
VPAVTYNTVIEQGADWYVNFQWKDSTGTPINVTGYTAALQIRTSPLAKTTVLSLTNGSGITITGATGLFAIHATAAQTTAITNGTYAYDMEITSGSGVVTRLVQGTINVSPQVTRT